MRGKKTSPEKVEEIKALSLIYDPKTISEKLGIPLRTTQSIIARKDNPVIESKRDEKRLEIVDRVWDETEEEIQKEVSTLKEKGDMLLEHLTPEKATKARTTEITTGYGTLFDKRRLLQDKSTVNIARKLVFKVVTEDEEPDPEPDNLNHTEKVGNDPLKVGEE